MIQNIPKEKILEALQEGPTLPIKIVRKVGGDTMLVGAILSTLISSGDVAVSSLKIGGSPLYYIPGQEEKLEGFIDHLNEKDQKTYRLLKEKKILQESIQDPLVRVSLRTIKDFAKFIEIDLNGKKEIFWRFYQYPREEALEDAKKILEDAKKILLEQSRIKAEELKAASTPEPAEQRIEEEKKAQSIENIEKPVQPERSEHKKHGRPHKIDVEPVNEPMKAKEDGPAKEVEETKPTQELVQEPKPDKKDFFEQIKTHVHNMNLDIISKEKVKKTEFTLILKNHDKNEYIYCVAKDKKVVNEGDLSTAFVFSHNKKMPCLFLTTGILNKKAEAMTHKEFKDMKIEKM